MSEKITDKQLMALKGFAFDGDTGKTLVDLNRAVTAIGYTKDIPFAVPSWVENEKTPIIVNSYLDPKGNRVHVIWHSDESGLSKVVDVVFDAPSLERKKAEGSCGTCQGACNPFEGIESQN